MPTTHTRVVYPMLTRNGLEPRFERLRLIDAPTGDGTPGAPATGQAPATPPQGTPAPSPATVAGQQQPAPGAQVFSADYVQSLRGEAASYRTERNSAQQALAAKDAEIAQLKAAAEAGDKAAKALAQRDADTALAALITTAKGSPITLAAMRGEGLLDGLDLSTDDGKTKATAAIEKYLTDHPELKAAQVIGASTVDHAPGTGETQTKTLAGLVAAKYRE